MCPIICSRESEIEGVPDPLEDEHQHYMTLRQGDTQVQQQADIRKPLVNLVDNLVTMGSLYGGDNLMLASQYKRVSEDVKSNKI